mmetsp:Transcript_25406/g.68995  ORF Transcript_25406/g.68995 Transcript_25406/m.68995 type:complete len:206 (-) Transcript_25406:752-1369(-)
MHDVSGRLRELRPRFILSKAPCAWERLVRGVGREADRGSWTPALPPCSSTPSFPSIKPAPQPWLLESCAPTPAPPPSPTTAPLPSCPRSGDAGCGVRSGGAQKPSSEERPDARERLDLRAWGAAVKHTPPTAGTEGCAYLREEAALWAGEGPAPSKWKPGNSQVVAAEEGGEHEGGRGVVHVTNCSYSAGRLDLHQFRSSSFSSS